MKRSPFLVFALLFAACGEQEIRTYRIAKSAEDGASMPALSQPAPAAGPQRKSGAAAAPRWTVPSGWKELPASGMRKAAYRMPAGAELTVISLAGDGGGLLSNVNRWRGQLGLEPMEMAALESKARTMPTQAGNVHIVALGNAGKKMHAGILTFGPETWYFKMTGSSSAVDADSAGFEAFLGSLKPSGA